MYISVQFKDKAKNFKGRNYDFLLSSAVSPPSVGSIIRMYKADGGEKVCNATRVRVNRVMENSATADRGCPIKYEIANLED